MPTIHAASEFSDFHEKRGAPDGIRTHGPQIRNLRTNYRSNPTEPQ